MLLGAGSLGEPQSTPASDDVGREETARKQKKKKKKSKTTVGGRVFARLAAERIDISTAKWTDELALSSARLKLDHRRTSTLRLSIEAELQRNRVRLKDVFIRLRTRNRLVTVTAGRFKTPIGAITRTGLWKLPVIERGLLNERVHTARYEGELPVGGRAEGVQVTLRPPIILSPRISIGMFNSQFISAAVSEAPDPAGDANEFRDVYARVQITPHNDIKIGASGGSLQRVRAPMDVDRVAVGALDVSITSRWVHAWMEGFVGGTPFIDDADAHARGAFFAARALVAGQLRKPHLHIRRVEPFVGASLIELSHVVDDSRTTEWTVGINVAPTKSWRVTAQYRQHGDDRRQAGRKRADLRLAGEF